MHAKSHQESFSAKPLQEFDGSLQAFANKILLSKRASNEVKKLGKIDRAIREDMKQKGIELQSDEIFITDKKILKYHNHPKERKGAVIDAKRYSEIEKAIHHPEHIYEDITSNTIIYVYSSGYDNKVLKLVIHPNYKIHGNIFNLLKSIGIVESRQITHSAHYRKVK